MQVSDNVRQDLIKLIPATLVNEIACFTFYDYHPTDKNNIEIIICTFYGEVREFYKRGLVGSLALNTTIDKNTEIKIHRNCKCELFYLLLVRNELYILSKKDSLQVHKKFNNVDKYELNDTALNGQVCLKITNKDDAVPLVFDDNFESLEDAASDAWRYSSHDNAPLILQLATKLAQVKYGVKCYDKTLRDLISLRQNSAYAMYKRRNPNDVDGVYDKDSENEGTLKFKSQTPLVKVCNKKIIIIVEMLNTYKQPVEDVHILLHRTTKSSIVYTTKLFENIPSLPYWREKCTPTIRPNCKTAAVVVIETKELKHNINSLIEFHAVICYKKMDMEYLLPVENVFITANDTMDIQFDVLSNVQVDNIATEEMAILAVLATTEKTDLCLRYIKKDIDEAFEIKDIFSSYLKMNQLQTASNVFIHYISTYHILHGVMIIINQDEENRDYITVSVHTRVPCQVLALVHYIYDAVPFKIVITSAHQKIIPKNNELLHYYEQNRKYKPKLDIRKYGESIMNQTSILLEYLDKCMVNMNLSKNPIVQSKVGSEIDVYAFDREGFLSMRKLVLEEAFKGIKSVEVDAKSLDGCETEHGI